MQKNRHQYFRWTPRTAKITIMYVAVVPIIFGYVAYKTDVSRLTSPWGRETATHQNRDCLICGRSERATLPTNDRILSLMKGIGCVYINTSGDGIESSRSSFEDFPDNVWCDMISNCTQSPGYLVACIYLIV